MSALFANIAKHQQRRNAAHDSDDEQQQDSDQSYNNNDKMYEDYDAPDATFLPLEEHNRGGADAILSPPPSSTGGPSLRQQQHESSVVASSANSTASNPLSQIRSTIQNHAQALSKIRGRKFILVIMLLLGLKVFVATVVLKRLTAGDAGSATASANADVAPHALSISGLLLWTQQHPLQGMLCLILTIAGAVVVMVPVGTPLTLGCGYIYKGAYGWRVGLGIATFVAIGGSALGAVICFLLGRYLMREQVRTWTKKYPLFGAIDVATKENGLKIMAMLYLTPILPLGPVSYMCGTTSMKLSHFVIAKIASLPLMFLYSFIGASMGALIGTGSKGMEDELKEIEQNRTMIISGIGLSFVMIAGITHYIKKELNRVSSLLVGHIAGWLLCELSTYSLLSSYADIGASAKVKAWRRGRYQ